MRLQLTKSEWIDDWYVLEGGCNWASVEGTAEEWHELARAMKKKANKSFKRCAVALQPDGSFVFWSPRNSTGEEDSVRCPAEDARALEEHIIAVLGADTGKDGK